MIQRLYSWLHRKVSKSPEEEQCPSGGRWHSQVREVALEVCQGRKGRLLELGCGEGLFLFRLAKSNPELTLVGIDYDRSKICLAEGRFRQGGLTNIQTFYSDATRTPFQEGEFATVVCVNTIFNLNSIQAVEALLTEALRVCQPGGQVIFDFRNALNPFLRVKYALAPFYDESIRRTKLPLCTYAPRQIEWVLEKQNVRVVRRQFIGFPRNALAPIILVEVEKC